jgi:hypothetical protein
LDDDGIREHHEPAVVSPVIRLHGDDCSGWQDEIPDVGMGAGDHITVRKDEICSTMIGVGGVFRGMGPS